MIQDRKRSSSIDLSVGQPSLHPDSAPFETAAQWVKTDGCPYAPYQGLPELRERVAAVYGGRFHSRAHNVLVTNGSQEAIYLAVKSLNEAGKDEVLLTDPTYPSYSRCCDLEGIAWRAVALQPQDGFAIRADAIIEALRPNTRMVILGSPANPTGAVMNRRELERLAAAMRNRENAPILLVDEVYRELVYTSQGYPSVADIYENSITVQSLSKSCALTGLRLGFMIGSQEVVNLAVRAHVIMLMSVNHFAQRVALAILSDPQLLSAQRPWYVSQRELLVLAARDAGVEIIVPQGAFYALAHLPPRWHGRSTEAALALLNENDVVTVPGSIFGRQADDFLRISWSASAQSVRAGVARIGAFLAQSRAR